MVLQKLDLINCKPNVNPDIQLINKILPPGVLRTFKPAHRLPNVCKSMPPNCLKPVNARIPNVLMVNNPYVVFVNLVSD